MLMTETFAPPQSPPFGSVNGDGDGKRDAKDLRTLRREQRSSPLDLCTKQTRWATDLRQP